MDDDQLLAQTVTASLVAQHYAVDWAKDGVEGWDYAQAATYDLIVLDIDLPQWNGVHLCQQLRQQGYNGPILLLTAKGTSTDKVLGLDAGADDYVVKPCTTEELGARIRALLRRRGTSGNPHLMWGDLCLDPNTCQVTYQDQLLSLSPKEYALLELFLRNPQRTLSSNAILEHLWGFDDSPGEETVRAHIKRLRRKLKDVGADEMIGTVYGMGYRLNPLSEQPSVVNQARVAVMATWQELKGLAFERFSVIDQAMSALKTGHLSQGLRQQAQQAAHKLAGSLGMFGFAEGSQIALQIEMELQTLIEPRRVTHLQQLVAALYQTLQTAPQPYSSEPTPPSQQPAADPPEPIAIEVDAQGKLIRTSPTKQTEIQLLSQTTKTSAISADFSQLPTLNSLVDLSSCQYPQELDQYLSLSQRYRQPLCIAIVVLANLSELSSHHQHSVSHEILQRIAKILRQMFRREDVIAPWNGEGFMIGVYGMKKQQLKKRLTQLLQVVYEDIVLVDEETSLQIAFNVGIAEAPDDGLDLNTLYRSAQHACKEAEAEGEDWIKFAKPYSLKAD